MRRPAAHVMLPGLVQAQLAVYREPDFRCVLVLLAIVFPPADGAKSERSGGFQSPVSTTRATKASQ